MVTGLMVEPRAHAPTAIVGGTGVLGQSSCSWHGAGTGQEGTGTEADKAQVPGASGICHANFLQAPRTAGSGLEQEEVHSSHLSPVATDAEVPSSATEFHPALLGGGTRAVTGSREMGVGWTQPSERPRRDPQRDCVKCYRGGTLSQEIDSD